MIKLLLVEDDPMQFDLISKTLTEHFGSNIEIQPSRNPSVKGGINDWNYFLHLLGEKKFKEVLEYYNDIDFFILDIGLTQNAGDKTGIDFFNFLKPNYGKPFKHLFISNIGEIEAEIGDGPFISKLEFGKTYPKKIVEVIKKMMPDLPIVDKALVVQKKSADKAFGRQEKWIQFNEDVQRYVIDSIILVLFYVTIIFSIAYAGFGIVRDLIHSFKKSDANETNILELAEHIFLYMLPIFIIFGFFNYYKSNARITLLKGNTLNIDHDASIKAIKISKNLFLSSITSYVIVKIIEMVFVKKECNITILISSGILLLVLIIYILLHEKRH